MKTALFCVLLALASATRASGLDTFLEVLRSRAGTFPLLLASSEVGAPKLSVVRLNAPPIVIGSERYGAVRVVCPPEKAQSLGWLFSDTTNIEEYGLLTVEGQRLEEAFTRAIVPATAHADPEMERPGRHASSLPRPWDFFQLHVLGLSAQFLKPGAEYLIWFRFSDQRPTDLLLAATFLDPVAKLEPGDLPSIFGLPTLGEP